MQAFTSYTGKAVALDRANIDTDQIIPKQFLKTITREGLGDNLFDAWRFSDEGYPGLQLAQRTPIADFALNRYADATLLLARRNFGCGSSREHAVWSLLDYGIRVVIAPSFADIFFNNSIKNGLLPVVLTEPDVDALFQQLKAQPDTQWTVSLETMSLVAVEKSYSLTLDEGYRQRLLKGLDDIGMTLESTDTIRAFEQQHQKRASWLFADIQP